MKDKEKQINVSTKEEIEARNKIGKEKDELRQALLHYATAEATNGIKSLIDCEGCAFYLYENLGYRKIDKNNVVLSKEEWRQYVDNENETYYRGRHETEVYYKNIQIPRERKDTAEKFARDMFNHITTPEVWERLRQLWLSKGGNFKANKHIYDLLIEPIATKFGVEIKE